jgi:glucosamine--fructose-6-phosphate aminotransferase (isomerizing)
MCGIVGYVGNKPCTKILLQGLKQLEYRGYDSAGIGILAHNKFVVTKAVGKVDALIQKATQDNTDSTIGIAHTRWATHGGVSLKNTHPHTDCHQDILVVHNGIIENYQSLKEQLKAKKHHFVSETDTEVLAHLIEEHYTGDLLSAVTESVKQIVGTYGIAVLHKNHPHEIIVARNGSPLILGIGDNFSLVASDASAIVEHTDKVVYLHDGEVAQIKKDEYVIVDMHQQNIHRAITTLSVSKESAVLGNYKHFMLKEIEEQPAVMLDTLRGRIDLTKGSVILGGLKNFESKLRTIHKIIMVSCGTSYHAALVGKYMFEETMDMEVTVENASEFRYKKIHADPATTLMIALSQSGETADTIAAVKEAKRKGFLTLGIVNVVGSTIAREVDAGIYTHAGFEIGVASTKAFTTQLAVLALLLVYIGRLKEMSVSEGKAILEELLAIPHKMKWLMEHQKDHIKKIAKKYGGMKNFLYLGRKYNFPIALEGALKLKEVSYIHAEGYPAGEMKHGPIAMIDAQFPSVVIALKDDVYDKTINGIEEIKARKGPMIVVGSKGDKRLEKLVPDMIEVEKTIPILSPLLTVIPLQFLAYYMADFLKRDIDKPRNLAKSVTVE